MIDCGFWMEFTGGYRFRSDAVQQLTVGTRLDDRLVTWISRGHSFYLFVGMQNCVYLIGEQNLVWKVENLAFPNFREGHLFQTVLSGVSTVHDKYGIRIFLNYYLY
jgi:hypothetical protein